MDISAAPSCPTCGFRVFNRRYPRCESCGSVLPESIAYNDVERHALVAADDERQRAHDRLERIPGLSDFGPASLDDAVLAAAVKFAPDL